MATFEILDGYASVRANQRIQAHGRTLLVALLLATAALTAIGILAGPGAGAALLTAAIVVGVSAVITGQRNWHTEPIDGIELGPSSVEVGADALTVVHPMLATPLVIPYGRLRCFAAEVRPEPVSYVKPHERFPVGRRPGLGYRLWEPHFLLSTQAEEEGRRNVLLLHLSLDDPVRPTAPNLALLFDEPIRLTAAVGVHDRMPPRRFWSTPATGRRSEQAIAEDRNRTWDEVRTPGVYLRVADPHRLRLALREHGVRDGIDADDVPGAPPHLPLPPPGTT